MEEIKYNVLCACCGYSLEVKEIYIEIPKFGRTVIISMLCANCGYRVNDVVPLEYKGASKIEYKVKGLRDLSAKVIRSKSARIVIPELGLELTPGPRAEGFITNVEGVLDRFLCIAEYLYEISSGVAKRRAKNAIDKIKQAMNGEFEFTIIMEDELGNSAIIKD
ncbi:MAG: ZPR1 zinc finger domain-containing protein [Candidatus Methanomethyliaceae archaeon]|nr:ZPR1 zinc finger domain-containing protein [Candidatus Methanomethyliaceae archaeon]MDW7970775.1 ZPR1 zinc finger domain-containing protein [Nitrososphaerota archaeon]